MRPDNISGLLPEILVSLDGPLCSPSVYRVYEQMSDVLLRNAPIRLVLDLSGVTQIDASGLGEIMRVHSLASERNSICELRSIPSLVRQLLSITAYDQSLHIVKSSNALPRS